MHAMQSNDNDDRLIGHAELRELVPLSPTQIWRKEQEEDEDERFPQRVKLSKGQGGRVAWSLREVRDWIARRKAARPNNTTEIEPQAP
jgi:predicted DNA-binding transcriptional regulator AlpA